MNTWMQKYNDLMIKALSEEPEIFKNKSYNARRKAAWKTDEIWEQHHIVPQHIEVIHKPSNLVAMTPEDHWLAHYYWDKAHNKESANIKKSVKQCQQARKAQSVLSVIRALEMDFQKHHQNVHSWKTSTKYKKAVKLNLLHKVNSYQNKVARKPRRKA